MMGKITSGPSLCEEFAMMATGHMLSGAVLAGMAAPLVPSPMSTPVSLLAGMAAGAPLALVMDLDTRGKAYHLLGPVGWLLRPVLVWLACSVFALTRGPKDAEETNGHRMLTHQVEFAAVLALVAFLATSGTGWEWWAGVVTFVGVWAHRAGDACTKSGVPVSLTRVLVRAARDRDERWLRTGIPRRLRFVTGGGRQPRWAGRGRRRHQRYTGRQRTFLRRWWDRRGEELLTCSLALGMGAQLGWVLSWYV